MFGSKAVCRNKEFVNKVVSLAVGEVGDQLAKCDTCLCLLKKEDAQKINIQYGYSTSYYCASHRKPYSKIVLAAFGVDLGPRYFGEVEMTIDGTPIMPKKK